MGNDEKKKGLLNAVGSAISKAGELGVKAGGAIKDFAESEQAEKMAEIVLKNAKLSFKERVLDAYSGIGLLGLYLAHNSKEVVGIEYNPSSVDLANKNAKLNKINNAKFYQGDSGELLEKLINDGEA